MTKTQPTIDQQIACLDELLEAWKDIPDKNERGKECDVIMQSIRATLSAASAVPDSRLKTRAAIRDMKKLMVDLMECCEFSKNDLYTYGLIMDAIDNCAAPPAPQPELIVERNGPKNALGFQTITAIKENPNYDARVKQKDISKEEIAELVRILVPQPTVIAPSKDKDAAELGNDLPLGAAHNGRVWFEHYENFDNFKECFDVLADYIEHKALPALTAAEARGRRAGLEEASKSLKRSNAHWHVIEEMQVKIRTLIDKEQE